MIKDTMTTRTLFTLTLLVTALLVSSSTTTTHAEAVDSHYWDNQAYQLAQAYFPNAGFVVKVRYPLRDYWTYEIYRIEFFGRPLLVASGRTWGEAFRNLDELRRRPLPPPYGR